jgi:hypothetical protein
VGHDANLVDKYQCFGGTVACIFRVSTWYDIPKDCNFSSYHCENLKSHTVKILLSASSSLRCVDSEKYTFKKLCNSFSCLRPFV